jgi:nucleoside-diphosphate-sugar epimerase
MILITGTNGLLGSYLAKKLLQQGKKVRGLKRITSDLSLLGNYANQIDWVTGDIMDVTSLEQAMFGIEQVYHCAAVISFSSHEANAMMKTNIEGTANVMNAALYAEVERVVHVSSIAAFGIHKPEKVIDEKTVYNEQKDMPNYYRSKQLAEREAWRAQAEGLNVVVANPGTILGAGKWDMEPNSVFRDVYAGLPFYTNGMNSFVDVRDVVDCLILLMEKGVNGEQYIIHSENVSFKDLLQNIAAVLGKRKPSFAVSASLAKIAVVFEWLKAKITGKRQLLTPEMARLANKEFRYSNQKIVHNFGVKFRSINETIADTAKVFLQSKKEGKNFGVFQ